MRKTTLAVVLWAMAIFLLGGPYVSQTIADGISMRPLGPYGMSCTVTACTMTVPLLVPNGSAALPGLAFAGEPSTGLYWVGSNFFDIATFGIARYRITSTSISPLQPTTQTLGSQTQQWTSAWADALQGSRNKALTDAAAAVAVVRVPIASNGYQAGDILWNAQSTDATDYRTTVGTIHFAGISKGATPTCVVNVVGTDLTASSTANTLVCTWTNVVNTTNCDLSVTCTDNTAGTQTMSINVQPDTPTNAILVYP